MSHLPAGPAGMIARLDCRQIERYEPSAPQLTTVDSDGGRAHSNAAQEETRYAPGDVGLAETIANLTAKELVDMALSGTPRNHCGNHSGGRASQGRRVNGGSLEKGTVR